MKTKIAVLDGGLHHRKAFAIYAGIKFVPVHKVGSVSLGQYDLLVVPFHTNQSLLSRLKPRFQRFVEKGGVLVILGATEDSGCHWLPYCQWEGPYTKRISVHERESRDGSVLFRGLEADKKLKYHDKYTSHGALIDTSDKEGDCVLVTSEDNRSVLSIRRSGIDGTLFITTLDPDYHSISNVPGPSIQDTNETHINASILLRNIMDWAMNEVQEKSSSTRRLNRVLSGASGFYHMFTYVALLIFPAFFLTLAGWEFIREDWPTDDKTYYILASAIIALAGSFASIHQGWRQWKADKDK
ncbi:MAG: hypothetical protein KZQ92_10950 [Candidatus Thiodiazotropha sp. (ex Lucinoma borealis)]|nr:hypothetical protein [Candidatus Thiodiazotropha sp. (ex Lucinoma borealis)]MCU7864480.1 hypothetical protein [Candidatus Thiodiazotropha sp. (ex Lucinoma borealis)]MCU7868245.1 hypothetical protein [Candidatus Thiodiazotropha sp. (ex Lucinoma borealis)]